MSIERRRPRRVMDIEALVRWALQDQRADRAGWMAERGDVLLLRGSGGDSAARVARRGALGVTVDGGGSARRSGQVPEDAEACFDEISKLPRRARDLVIAFGRIGERPDWIAAAPQHQVKGRFWDAGPHIGQPVMGRTGRGWRWGRYCQLRESWDPHPDLVAARRATYGVWRGGLKALAKALRRRGLRRFLAVGPVASAAPWEGDLTWPGSYSIDLASEESNSARGPAKLSA